SSRGARTTRDARAGASVMSPSGPSGCLVYIIPYEAPLRTQINPVPAQAAVASRILVRAFWISGQNSAIRPKTMIEETRPLEKKTPRLPPETSGGGREDSAGRLP